MPPKRSKTYLAIKECYKEVLEGKVLAIDPSTGSQSSRPGYAWFEKGKLIESGEISLDISQNRSLRLYEIARTIREDFEKPDVLIVEYIPPVTYGSGHKMNKVAIMALQKAIGAIIGAVPVQNLLEIPASAWKAWKPSNYVKTDEFDAVSLGLCAIGTAELIKNTER